MLRTTLRFILTVLWIAFPIWSGTTYSQNIDVPDGDVSALIDAISDANDNPDEASVIVVGGTYTLSPEVDNRIPFEHNGHTGLPAIRSEITIKSSGQSKATIQRDPELDCELDRSITEEKFRVMFVGEDAALTLENLSVSNGCMDDSDYTFRHGGGIKNHGFLKISESELSGNSAYENGGGIFNDGTLEIINSEIADSFTERGDGGGIFNDGTLEIINSEIADSFTRRDGGGLQNENDAKITGSTISGNSTGRVGGGIFNEGYLELSGTGITDNFSEESGGGIINFGNMLITDTKIANNITHWSAGGIYNNSELEITNSEITGNVSEGTGASNGYAGGILNFHDGNLVITGSTITNNTAADDGGGIYNNGELELSGTGITDNFSEESGGGISNSEADTKIINSKIINNSAGSSGGGISNSTANLEIIRSEVSSNSAGTGGGGIRISGSRFQTTFAKINDSEISNNSAFAGGGISIGSNTDSTQIILSEITDNSAENSSGGGISNGSVLNVTQSAITDNTSVEDGGGIRNEGELHINKSTIADNTTNGFGGGIENTGLDNNLDIVNSTFWGNSASFGGAIANGISGVVSVTASTLAGNSANNDGGGIYNEEDNTIDEEARIIVKNSIVAESLNGNDCYNEAEFTTLGANISSDASCPDFSLSETDPQLDPEGPRDHDGPTSVIEIMPGSPALDAAIDCSNLEGSEITTDQIGVPRPQGDACDIGAYESGFEPGELALYPDQGSDAGIVTITVFGSDFSDDHSVALTRENESDIIGRVISTSGNGTEMEVRFDLSGQPQESWNLVVTNPEGLSLTLEDAFTVIEGEEPEVWIDIQGADRITGGESSALNINYGNRGETDVHDVLLFIHFPDNLEFQVDTNNIAGAGVEDWIDPNELEPDARDALALHINVEEAGRTVLPLWIHRLSAQSSLSLRLEVTPEDVNNLSRFSRPVHAEIGAVSVRNNFSRTGNFDEEDPALLDIFATSIIEAGWEESQQSSDDDVHSPPNVSDLGNIHLQKESDPCNPIRDRLENLPQQVLDDREAFLNKARELTPTGGEFAAGLGAGLGSAAVCAATAGLACLAASAGAAALDLTGAIGAFTTDVESNSQRSVENKTGNIQDQQHPCVVSDESEHDPDVVPEFSVNTASRTFGDPHLMTFDQRNYEFQAVGEFILTRSEVDEMEIQVRLEQLAPEFENFSIITATALNVAGDEVVFEEDRDSPDNVPALQINGTMAELPEQGAEPTSLPAGGSISRGGAVFSVRWPNEETRVDVQQSAAAGGMTVEPMLSVEYIGNVEGLLGTMDGNSETDFRMRDGTVLTHPLSFEELYRDFGDSWRITQEESLFGTETFEDLGIPNEHVTTEQLDHDEVQNAEVICRDSGVEDPTLLDNCIFDVVMSGDNRYAEDAASIITPSAKEHANEILDENDSKLQILLDVNHADGRDFSFSGTGEIGDFTLSEDDHSADLTFSKTYHNLTPGSYEVSQELPAEENWSLDNITCNTEEGVTVDIALGSVTIELDEGKVVRCTFENIGTVTSSDDEADIPESYSLSQNYPNPFNPVTTIRYELPESVDVQLEVYNILGQRVATLVDSRQHAGLHEATFDGTRLSSGVYIYRIQAGTFEKTREMTLIK